MKIIGYCSILSVLIASLAAQPAGADPVAEFYSRTSIRLLISGDSGGSYDTDARLIARHLGKHIPGNPRIVPENMLGASGRVAANYAYHVAPKDGSVLAVVQQTIALGQVMGESGVQYDAALFNWIGSPVRPEEVLVVWHTAGVHSIEDAKKKEVIIGATSPTGTNFIYPKLTNELLGTRFKIVTGYPGGAPIVLALERGEVQGRGANPWSEWKIIKPDWVRDKKIIPLVQMSLAKRSDLPDVPLLIDLAPNDEVRAVFELVSIPGAMGRPLVAPPGVPADRVAALRKAFNATIADPEFLAEAERARKEIQLITGEELESLARRVLAAPRSTADRLKAALSAKAR